MSMDANEIITVDEAAKILGVTARQVRWYHQHGHLPGRRIGARVLVFARADVEELVNNKPKKTGRPPAKKAPAPPPAKKKPKKGK